MGSKPGDFAQRGFTAGNNGRLGVPELVFDNKKFVTPTEGAEIWKVNYDGSQEPVAIFKNGRFNKIK